MQNIINKQIDFFAKYRTGCGFASKAATNPKFYGWHHRISELNLENILHHIHSSVEDPNISTLSILLPQAKRIEDLCNLISDWSMNKKTDVEYTLFKEYLCVGLRVLLEPETAWVSGFGPFDFLPKTRQAPYVELTLRVKPRPAFDKVMAVMKQYTGKTVHLADMDMRGMSERTFRKTWKASHICTAKILGGKPDLLSAAKTTFSIPSSIALEKISPEPRSKEHQT